MKFITVAGPPSGVTVKLPLNRNPAEYTAIEVEEAACKGKRISFRSQMERYPCLGKGIPAFPVLLWWVLKKEVLL